MFHPNTSYNTVVLMRAAAGSSGERALLAWLKGQAGPETLVFVHGPALDALRETPTAGWSAALQQQRASLWLCLAGWERRGGGEPPPGWRPGSLVGFWAQAQRGAQLLGFGVGHA